MRTIVVGAGPAGLYSAIALARRGREVLVVDRDPGPPERGWWRRRGVMQFHQAHTFRRQVIDALAAELPDVLDALIAAGAETATDNRGGAVGLLCRRMAFDRALWASAVAHRNLAYYPGNVDAVQVGRTGKVAVRVGTATLEADLVLDASGRDSRFTRSIRPPARGEACGAAYVSRQYQLHRRATPPPMSTPFGTVLSLNGYWALAYLHDNGAFSVTIVHDGTEPRLLQLRHPETFEAAVREIPALSDWIEPSRSRALTGVMPGSRLYNGYRGQCDDMGRVPLPGLISLGDAVCTTTPLAGRGVALALMQARELMSILDHSCDDIRCATVEFDDWCVNHIPAVVHRPRLCRRRSGAALVRSRRRPHQAAAVGPDRRRGRRRRGAGGDRRAVHHDGRAPRQPLRCRTTRQKALRKRLAPNTCRGSEPRGPHRDRDGGVQDTGKRLIP